MSEAKQILEKIINDFSADGFSRFFREQSRQFTPRAENYARYSDADFKNGLKLGEINFSKGDNLIVCAFEVKKELSERAGKKAQYEKAKNILKSAENQKFSAGIFIFYDLGGNFRFSLVYPEALGARRQWSNFRRFTYFVSREFTNKTFLQRIGDGDFESLEKVKEAFSVEKVTKEFYLEYRKLFDNLLSELSKNYTFLNEAAKNGLNAENFAKKLLGQIVFLYFIQKKGWLGVPENAKWGQGDKNYLSNLFKQAKNNKKNFYNNYLEKLFYNALNNPRRGSVDPSFSKDFNCRIPFLNGGLFEAEYNWQGSFIYVDDKIFQAIFDVFDRYNFTVEEESPDDKEIAVDPEMLGKVFENLLSEHLRKGKGTYYTPREIVYYMCQESLINYLVVASDLSEVKIREYIDYANTDFADLNKKWKAESFKHGQFKKIDDLLANIKVVDPACGSGAFLVGMLNLIVKLRIFLQFTPDSELYLDPSENTIKQKTEYELKKETIQNCIYGVDIDPGAIEIAKLRLWLQLVVDYELKDIEPLPNLDYRLMCGNSLLEEFEGVKFYNGEETEQQGILLIDTKKQEKVTELKKKVKEYFDIHDDKEKQAKRKEINDIKDWLVRSALEKRKQDLAAQRKNEEAKASMLNQKSREKYLASWGNKFLAETKIKEVLDNLHNPKKEKPFFIWKLEFIDVFEDNGGFDVVIANPPYVEHKKLKRVSKLLRKFKVYSGTADLYVYFYEVALNILRERGILTFISSNKFIRARYGFPLRDLLARNKIYNIVDFTKVKAFDALVASCIILVSKDKPSDNVIVTFVDDTFTANLADYIENNHAKILSASLNSDMWQLEDETKLAIKKKVEINSEKLGIIQGINIFRGITTGYNLSFIIDNKKRKELLDEDRANKAIIKPLLQGRNIKKWVYNKTSNFLIFTRKGIDIKEFPSIQKYLNNFRRQLEPGVGRKAGSYNWFELQDNTAYYPEFEKEKIIWGLTSNKWTFAYDNAKNYLPSNGYILTSAEIPIKYLLALMNSKLMEFYFGFIGIMTAGGAYTLKRETIAEFPVKKLSKADQKPLIKIVNKILAITKTADYLQNPAKQAKVKEYEKQIDQMVYKLYNLTSEEIEVIEKNG